MDTTGTRTAGLDLDYPRSLAVYDTYVEAQRAVDHLSDEGFPVENLLIVGTDLKRIERVTGRLVWGLIGYAATRGRRDFSSVTAVVATRYEVLVEHRHREAAHTLLAATPGLLSDPHAAR